MTKKRRRHTPEQIIRKLDEVCRHLEIAESTWHRWLAQYGGTQSDEGQRREAPEGARG